jgi:hypothetical protein
LAPLGQPAELPAEFDDLGDAGGGQRVVIEFRSQFT